jgi:hypothetical protein
MGGKEHLWSVALVTNDEHGRPGLIWLSGTDYTERPTTAMAWRQRGKMQDRYLMSRAYGEPPRLPNGLRVIRLFPEWTSGWPLWESFSDAYHLDAADLDLSPELSAALYDWHEEWWHRDLDDPLPAGWTERGQVLFDRLQSELDGVAEVRPDFLF